MKKETVKKIKAIIEFGVLIAIIVGIPIYLYFFQHDLINEFKDVDKIVDLINDNPFKSSIIYLGIMILQVVVAIIPGQVIEMLGGYVFSVPLGLILSTVGLFMGTTVTYFIAKALGSNFIEMAFDEEKVEYYRKKLNSKRSYIIVFLIYLIPGIPKDLVGYVAGISDIDYVLFIIVSTVGRFPGLVGCIIIGEMTYIGNYTIAIVTLAFATILCILGVIYRKQINSFLDNKIEKLMNK